MLKQVVHIVTILLKRVHLLLALVLVVNYFWSVRGQSGGTQMRRVLASRSVAPLNPDRKVNKRNADATCCFSAPCSGNAPMSEFAVISANCTRQTVCPMTLAGGLCPTI